ncbi:hypothetical protein FS837_001170 [Tulasnella sp. UAMH 9824]|nr:hypothetical protein FS837_001170 [Tulasnella sp. UAMH 9824]
MVRALVPMMVFEQFTLREWMPGYACWPRCDYEHTEKFHVAREPNIQEEEAGHELESSEM